ncbi:DNA polymerase lambda [Colletotrichum spaethianum]|uniref:DNA polymerase lambda n=1 Tax=Colletotrichum spaethianum TaxID=700344 RepID=A0AA37NXH6_9PEZI|nr:DNA polymerase lambda [Colletotrichum spaethianum]GKT40073.1 DNA polymerase lambda [Colletotrichum spaethianum]
MADTNTSFRDKARFFRQLESLGRQSDDDDDDEFQEAEQRHRQQLKAFQAAAQPRRPLQEKTQREPQSQSQSQSQSPLPQHLSSNLRRTSPVPVPAPAPAPASFTDLKRKEVIKRTPLAEIKGPGRKDAPAADSFIEDTPIPDSSARPPLQPIPSLTRSVTTPLPATKHILPHRTDNSPSIAAMKKRKRDPPIKTVSEDQQIFRGLRFYFIPNDDIAPARKIRIRKAQEFGASWVRSLENATHVIVDSNLNWKSIESIVSSEHGAHSYLVLNEEYPLDCLRFKTLLNAEQKQYRVSGCPEPSAAPAEPRIGSRVVEPLAPNLQDLPLKSHQTNPKRWDYARPLTPSRSQGSSGRMNEKDAAVTSSSVLRDITEIVQPSNTHGHNNQSVDGSDDEPPATVEEPVSALKDELEDVISQMQEFRDLPLEHDDDDMTTSTQLPEEESGGEGSEDERQRKKRAVTKTRGRKDLTWEDKFACHNGGTNGDDQTNPNSRTIDILQQMCNYYERINDTWRPIAYRKAITQLKRQTSKISTAEEAIRLPGVGQRLADKIEEIVTTNRLQRLESAEREPMDEVLQMFLKIYGVGSVQASLFISQGFRTLEDLKEKAKLTPNQRVGIYHYEDLNTRIPRSEIKLLGAVVRSEAVKLDPTVELIIGGSYRRGAMDSGDIDFIVTKKGTRTTSDLTPFLHHLVKTLEAQNFLVARLAGSRDETDGSKWHGCCVLPKIRGINDKNYRRVWRRVDFLVVPETEIGAALIYFTGNDIFNRSIRLLASKKGMRLNQKGLYKDVMRGPGRVKLTEGELVEGRDERRIFEILGVKWREPHERWC